MRTSAARKTEPAERRSYAPPHALFVTAARFEEVRGAFGRRIGATGPQYTILAAIAERQARADGVGIRALANHLHVAPSHITAEVNKLAALGLVAKRANP